MASKPISITLPEAMLREVERVSKAEHRTRSELVREALRNYLGLRRVPVAEPTAKELAMISRGEAEIARGEYATLDELTDELGTADRPRRAAKPTKVSRKGSKAPRRGTR